MADRAVAPATGKLLEVAIVVLFVGVLTTSLYGGVVPDYRSTAGQEVAERTLSTGAHRVQQTVPPNGTSVEATTRVRLPETIRGRPYEIRTDGRELVLEHPHPGVHGRTPLALPDDVVSVSGRWDSTDDAYVTVSGTGRGLEVRLTRGGSP